MSEQVWPSVIPHCALVAPKAYVCKSCTWCFI